MPDVCICEVTDNTRLTETAYSVEVVSGYLAANARAGQFLHVKCADALLLRRPFGICNVTGDVVRFVFEVKGEGTRRLSECKPGACLDILGPLGNGFDILEGNIIIVGGGLGTPPMLYAARSVRGKATAVLGFRETARVMLVSEFEEICDRVFLTTDDGSMGVHGTVSGPLEELLSNGGYDAVLACGQLAMQRAVAKLCEDHNVPCRVSLEERMGCGVGACLVCACDINKDGKRLMSRVCRDGPVFNAVDVIWKK